MTRAYRHPNYSGYATSDDITSQGPGDPYAAMAAGAAPKQTETKEELKARAAIQRERLIRTEELATSCAPTMRTIRLCDNSAYDSNCPAVWRHAAEMGCVIR